MKYPTYVVLYMHSMTPALRPRTLGLFVGDLLFFTFSLWLSLYLRTFDVPSLMLFWAHLVPFSLLFLVWAIVFFIAGLYESRSIILERRAISITLLATQLANVIIAALFFSLIPIFGIAPKTLLVIYLIVSFILVLLWRVALFPQVGFRRKEQALVVGGGGEVLELVEALYKARHAPTVIAQVLEPESPTLVQDIQDAVAEFNPRFIIADFTDPLVVAAFPNLYNYLTRGIRFFDALSLYEEVFGRVPLSVINQEWLARNVSRYSHTLYDTFKRIMDIAISIPIAILSLVAYPFIAAAIKLEDRGPVLISLPRVGEANQTFNLYKFRSMSGNDGGTYGTDGVSKLRVTRVGKFLRITRLDEIPQLWSVIAGRLSLIGPRPETPTLVELYTKEIPYYNVRHLVRPGLSGWAQLYGQHAHHGVGFDETRNKLSHDLYYIKHRSLTLDAVVILKTIKKLFTRSGV